MNDLDLVRGLQNLLVEKTQLESKLKAAELQIRELEKAAEGGLRITCDNAYHDRGHGVCSFCVQKRIDEAIKTECQRCACVALSVWSAVPEDHMAWKRCQNAIHLKIRAADDVVEKPISDIPQAFKEAKAWLEGTEKRIDEVCESCGWNNGPNHGGGSRVMYTMGKITRCADCCPRTR